MDTAGRALERKPADGSWFGHVRATLFLGLPLVGAQLAQLSINVTDTIMVGRLGTVELAAAVITAQFFHLVWMLGSGFAIAVMPMAASAQGKGDVRGVRRAVRMGLWVVALYSAIVMVPLWFTRDILLGLGQDPEVAALAGLYMRILQWAMLPALAVMIFRSFLSAIERPSIVLYVTIFGALLNALIAYAFIYGNLGAPALGIAGAGVAGVATMTTIAVMLGLYGLTPDLKRYELFVRFWRPDWAAFLEVARLGWPIGLTIVAEVGLFAATSVMIGWIGPVELAAHGIALQLASIAFMIPLGFSNAATVRVGLAYGRRDALGVARAARAAYAIGLLIALCAALLFWTAPVALIGLYLDRSAADAELVLGYAVSLLAIAAAFQLFDAGQVMASGVLRGLKDTRLPMIIAIVSYWLVGMPTGYLLGFGLGWGAVGVWWGLAFGLFAAAALMTARFLRRERRGEILFGA